MARKTRRAPLMLSDVHRRMLTELSGSRTAPVREVERSKALLRYAEGRSIADIQRQLGVSRPAIYKGIDKALAAGVQVGLKDAFHRPGEPEILADAVIRVVLDNHSAHISKETMAYLATRPGRFEYVHTPKTGSWLNLIECAFSKMARTFLRHIRVSSKAELKQRILQGIAEFNQTPVPFRWKKFDSGLA